MLHRSLFQYESVRLSVIDESRDIEDGTLYLTIDELHAARDRGIDVRLLQDAPVKGDTLQIRLTERDR